MIAAEFLDFTEPISYTTSHVWRFVQYSQPDYSPSCRQDGLSSTGGIETFNRCAATSTQLNQCLLLPHRLHLINNRTRISLIDLLEFILLFQDWITMRMSHPSHSAFYSHIGNRCILLTTNWQRSFILARCALVDTVTPFPYVLEAYHTGNRFTLQRYAALPAQCGTR